MKVWVISILFILALNADTPIKIDKILKPNEALVIDGRTNKINFALEITKDGRIKKRFLSESQKEALYTQLNMAKMPDSTRGIKKATQADKYPHSHIKEWDKSKIIYEQIVDKIEILR